MAAAEAVGSPTPRAPRGAIQFGALLAALGALGFVMLVAASPGHATVAPAPPPAEVAAPTVTPAPAPILGSQAAPVHLVLIVDDLEVGRRLSAQIDADQLVIAERGANAPALEVEVIEAHSDAEVSALLTGLDEAQLLCGVESTSCDAYRVLDLRTGRTPR